MFMKIAAYKQALAAFVSNYVVDYIKTNLSKSVICQVDLRLLKQLNMSPNKANFKYGNMYNRIIVLSDDPDVLVILLYYYSCGMVQNQLTCMLDIQVNIQTGIDSYQYQYSIFTTHRGCIYTACNVEKITISNFVQQSLSKTSAMAARWGMVGNLLARQDLPQSCILKIPHIQKIDISFVWLINNPFPPYLSPYCLYQDVSSTIS